MDDFKRMVLDKEAFQSMSDLKIHEDTCMLTDFYKDALDEIIPSITVTGSPTTLGKDIVSDLEITTTYTGELYSPMTLIGCLDRCKLHGGALYFEKIILNPIHDLKTLRSRQATVKTFQNTNTLQDKLDKLSTLEHDMLWMYKRSANELESLYDMVYFTSLPLKPLNSMSHSLTLYNVYRIAISPVIGMISPIVMIIVPYLIMRHMKLDVPISQFIKMLLAIVSSSGTSYGYLSLAFTILMYLQNTMNSVELARTSYKISNIITTRMNNVAMFINTSNEINEMVNESLSAFNIDNVVSQATPLVVSEFSIFNNFGQQLKTFKHFDKTTHIALLNRMYLVDAVNCIKRISKDKYYSFANYTSSQATLTFEDFYHPCLSLPIKNNVSLGDLLPNNMLMTSPNASGKSTLIKSILIGVLLAQTLTTTCMSSCTLSPFSYISSQINIPDCKGKESLFEGEMLRSKGNLDALKRLPQSQFALIACDEIFNSTSPVEGIAGAYAIATKLSEYSNCISIISTHFVYLTKLEKDTKRFINYKMKCLKSSGKIKYPYKLSKGISNQHIALDILEENGFDKDILECSRRVVAQIHKK